MSQYEQFPDPAAAIRLARQYERLCPEYPDQRLSLPELKIALGQDCYLESLPERYADAGMEKRHIAELALELLGITIHGLAIEPDPAVYLTITRRDGHASVTVDYGREMLAVMHYAAYNPQALDYPVAGFPELVASDLMRQPYWEDEVIESVTLDELEVDGTLTSELAAQIYVRRITF